MFIFRRLFIDLLSVFIITLYTQFLKIMLPIYHLEEKEKTALQ